jgi:phosphopantothenoylcysteine decarboxylase
MNTHMWEHPFTQKHLTVLEKELGYAVVDPVSKLLACGDRGERACG